MPWPDSRSVIRLCRGAVIRTHAVAYGRLVFGGLRHCASEQCRGNGHAKRNDFEKLEGFTVIAEFVMPGDEPSFFEFGEVHVEKGARHSDAASELTYVLLAARQFSQNAHALRVCHGGQPRSELS
tara:strand:- start:1395 stop:1769 length:375 start_codon:yes stop_codon:yes gene_type:complete